MEMQDDLINFLCDRLIYYTFVVKTLRSLGIYHPL